MKRKKTNFNKCYGYVLNKGDSTITILNLEALENSNEFDKEYKQKVIESFEHMRRVKEIIELGKDD